MASSVDGRLSRIEGHVRALRRMAGEEHADCLELMTQVHAIKAAMDQAALVLLNEHVRACLLEAVQDAEMGHAEAVDRMAKVIERYALS